MDKRNSMPQIDGKQLSRDMTSAIDAVRRVERFNCRDLDISEKAAMLCGLIMDKYPDIAHLLASILS